MTNKKLILAAVALVAVIACFLAVWIAVRPDTSAGSKTITVTVVHADGTSKDFTIRTDEEFLAGAMLAEGLLLESESESGMYTTVDGEAALWDPDQAYWALYIGADYAMTGANETPINDGDSFKWVYTIG